VQSLTLFFANVCYICFNI